MHLSAKKTRNFITFDHFISFQNCIAVVSHKVITSHTNLCVFVTFQKSRLSRREEKDDNTDYKRLTRTCLYFMMLTAHPPT